MGFSLEGYYIGVERREFKNDDGSIDVKWNLNVAIGSLAYRVYMDKDFDPQSVADLKPGDLVVVSVRCYVGKNNKLSLVEGKLI